MLRLLRTLLCTVLMVGACCRVGIAQGKPAGPAKAAAAARTIPPLPIPPDNSDLAKAEALANRLKARGDSCKRCRDGGGDVDCAAATQAVQDADDLRVALYSMQAALKAAMDDLLKHMQQVQADENQRAASDASAKNAQAWSKAALTTGKLAADVASLGQSLDGIKDALKELPKNLTVVPDLNDPIYSGAVKNMDTWFEAASTVVSTGDDVISTNTPHLPGAVSNVMTVKGAATDLMGAVTTYSKYEKALQAAKTAKDIAEAGKLASEARKGLVNVALKVGIAMAEYEQKLLQDEIDEYEKVGDANAKLMQQLIGDERNLARRQTALKTALFAARDAATATYGCAARCSGAMPPRPLPAPPANETYGAALKRVNPELAAVVARASPRAAQSPVCKDKPKPGVAKKAAPSAKPTSTATPNQSKKTNCVNNGGLAGAINQEACQIQHQ